MRSIIRLVAASALSLPLVIGAAGIASADVEFDQDNASASAGGAVVHNLSSGANDEGDSYFYETYEVAGPHGAGSFYVLTWTWSDSAGYHDGYAWSSPDGAWVGTTNAHADDNDYADDTDYEADDDYEADGDHDEYED